MFDHVYEGSESPTGTVYVLKNGRPFSPERSLRHRNHSPAGFMWGYEGSGPAQLALALLLDALNDSRRALIMYQRFKREVIARFERSQAWQISQSEIAAWAQTEMIRIHAESKHDAAGCDGCGA